MFNRGSSSNGTARYRGVLTVKCRGDTNDRCISARLRGGTTAPLHGRNIVGTFIGKFVGHVGHLARRFSDLWGHGGLRCRRYRVSWGHGATPVRSYRSGRHWPLD